jgi:hypothetical protein
VITFKQQWLDVVPWEMVVSIHEALCNDKKLGNSPNLPAYETAQRLWNETLPKTLSLKEALDVCRKCHDLTPFTFNNGNTFSAIGKTLIEDLAKNLSPVEAQIVRTTVGHYVVGMIQKGELAGVLRHFAKQWKPRTKAALPLPAGSSAETAPQPT